MKTLTTLAIALAISASFTVVAEEGDYDKLRQVVSGLVPTAENIAIADSAVDNLYEVQIDSDIVYLSGDGKILVQGRMYDIETRTDLTENTRSVIRKSKMKDIDRGGQIVFAPEIPTHELTVFTDIDCGYCRRLHGQIAEYNAEGISIRYMMFPRAGIGSQSYDKAVSVWCAEDQRTALTDAKLGTEPEPRQCENPIAEQYALGQAMGISGTPALMTSDGTLIPGYVPPKALKQRLEAINQTTAAATAE